MITGMFPTICADDVAAARDFYRDLFGFGVLFDSDWYVHMEAPDGNRPQLAIVARTHDSVPEGFRNRPAGVLVAIEVDDVDALHARAHEQGRAIVQPLRDEVFGQRHFMTLDPAGTVIDVITPIAPSPEFAAQYAEA